MAQSPRRAHQGRAAPRRGHHLRLERRAHPLRGRGGARQCGREVVVVGRAMDRVIDVASECGYLDGLPEFRTRRHLRLPAARQGRGAAHRLAGRAARRAGPHRPATSIRTSRCRPATASSSPRAPSPATRRPIGTIINSLIEQGDRGHHRPHRSRPCLRPPAPRTSWRRCIAGRGRASPSRPTARPLHLAEHATFAQSAGRAGGRARARTAASCGSLRDRPRSSTTCRPAASTRTATSSSTPGDRGDPGAAQARLRGHRQRRDRHRRARRDRRRSGGRHRWACPARRARASRSAEIIADAVGALLDGLSEAKRRDPEAVETAVERAVRATVNEVWGKKPACHVLVVEV